MEDNCNSSNCGSFEDVCTNSVSTLLECVGAVLKYPQFKDAAQAIFSQCKSFIGATSGFVAVLSGKDCRHEVLVLDTGLDGAKITLPLMLHVPIAARIYENCEVFYSNDFQNSKWSNFLPPHHPKLENILFIPIVIDQQVVGLLALANKAGGFTNHDVKLGTYFGEFASIALHTKRTTQKLWESEERYRRLIEIIPDAIVISSHGKVVFANAAAARIFGAITPETLLGRSAISFVIPENHPEVIERLENFHSRFDVPRPVELECLKVDGSSVDVEVVASPLEFKGEPAELMVLRDISDRKKLEEEVLQATKLEAISVLAGGVAHDFNNLLTIVLGNLSIAKMYAANDTNILRKLREIENAAQQTKELTRQLLTLAKGSSLSKKIVSLEDILLEMATFALRGSNVEVKFLLPEGLPPVDIDASQFGQVINNLLINATQAMPNGGTVTIRAEVKSYLNTRHGAMLEPGTYIKISIRDEGCGIEPETLSKIFEPFFTTKAEGTGLGLATSYNIVRHHGGHLAVESEVGKGTTFYIYLPVSAGAVEQQNASDNVIIGHGKILLMDDDERVRKMAGEMLNLLGYAVDFAVNGKEALLRYQQALAIGHSYDLVILDMTVRGGMGGQKTMELLRESDPQVKAVISSGYATSDLLLDHRQYGFKAAISKPYKIEELSNIIQKVLTPEEEEN